MSRVGAETLEIPSAVKVNVSGRAVDVSGPKGKLSYSMPEGIAVEIDGNTLHVRRASEEKQIKAFHGLVRRLIGNMVTGVNEGYQKGLEIHGVGFNAKLQGKMLTMEVGLSYTAEFNIPDGIEIEIMPGTNPVKFMIRGCDKQLVGETAARIRRIRPAEPYKGKGIRYMGEQIRRKAGKTFASS
jgi:large subunit ribosomal protein L6